MPDPARYYITTAIDYPNSQPHIGTAFEKLGADVQARYRRMQGHEVFFLMGNVKKARRPVRERKKCGVRTPNQAGILSSFDRSSFMILPTTSPCRRLETCS